jgi:type III secretory pathway lipoprotein EscJ
VVALVLQTDLDQISLDLEKIVVRDVSAQRAKIPMQHQKKKTKKGGMHVFSTKDITTTLVMLRICQLPKNDFEDIEKICLV